MGDVSGLSESKLMECVSGLGYDIEIEFGPVRKCAG
jgi:hypothetical protein